jgi:hypothetical protein
MSPMEPNPVWSDGIPYLNLSQIASWTGYGGNQGVRNLIDRGVLTAVPPEELPEALRSGGQRWCHATRAARELFAAGKIREYPTWY